MQTSDTGKSANAHAPEGCTLSCDGSAAAVGCGPGQFLVLSDRGVEGRMVAEIAEVRARRFDRWHPSGGRLLGASGMV